MKPLRQLILLFVWDLVLYKKEAGLRPLPN